MEEALKDVNAITGAWATAMEVTGKEIYQETENQAKGKVADLSQATMLRFDCDGDLLKREKSLLFFVFLFCVSFFVFLFLFLFLS